ncbi:MAG: hypothetical protein AABX65_03350, partial [Nanoarchaeota archaeon]
KDGGEIGIYFVRDESAFYSQSEQTDILYRKIAILKGNKIILLDNTGKEIVETGEDLDIAIDAEFSKDSDKVFAKYIVGKSLGEALGVGKEYTIADKIEAKDIVSPESGEGEKIRFSENYDSKKKVNVLMGKEETGVYLKNNEIYYVQKLFRLDFFKRDANIGEIKDNKVIFKDEGAINQLKIPYFELIKTFLQEQFDKKEEAKIPKIDNSQEKSNIEADEFLDDLQKKIGIGKAGKIEKADLDIRNFGLKAVSESDTEYNNFAIKREAFQNIKSSELYSIQYNERDTGLFLIIAEYDKASVRKIKEIQFSTRFISRKYLSVTEISNSKYKMEVYRAEDIVHFNEFENEGLSEEVAEILSNKIIDTINLKISSV